MESDLSRRLDEGRVFHPSIRVKCLLFFYSEVFQRTEFSKLLKVRSLVGYNLVS